MKHADIGLILAGTLYAILLPSIWDLMLLKWGVSITLILSFVSILPVLFIGYVLIKREVRK